MRLQPFALLALAALLTAAPSALADAPDPQGVEFFEKKIRPVLAEHCYSCHAADAKRVRGGLLLDSLEAMLKGGDSGPSLVPGDVAKSLLVTAVKSEGDLTMPPKGKLPDQVIADFVRWVEMGAPAPQQAAAANHGAPRKEFRITDADRQHWAFQPVRDVAPPAVKNDDWAKTALDRYVLAELETKGFAPAPPADRHTLLRRLSFDLTGLPPTPEEIEAFLADDSPRAVEKVVDRLLASKEFGIRWARHWLDGVRYSSDVDKGGRYRDWVVRAFNEDLPYDQFVRMQLAGDLIPATPGDPSGVHFSGASFDGVTATGMLALAVWEQVARDLAVAEIVDSQIDVVGRQLLGLTLACARCHDHKYDPIAANDYYALAGVFFSSHISPGKLIADGRLSGEVLQVPLLTPAEAEKNRRLDAEIQGFKKRIAALEKKAGPAGKLYRVRAEMKTLTAQADKATGSNKKKLQDQAKKLEGEEKKLLADRQKKGWSEDAPELAEIAALEDKAAGLEKTKVVPATVIGMQEGGVPGSNREKIGDSPVYIRGDYRKLGPVVPRRFPVILAGEDQEPLGNKTKGSGRLELADWVASPDNPLTARVMVNRVWLYLFGQGLVRTPDNFGLIGERPTHPELLDHLTARFVASGWSVKQLIRDIVLSAAYRQSSFGDPEMLQTDPENRLLGRMNRKRLDYEALQDSILFVSRQFTIADGQLNVRRALYEPLKRGTVDPVRMMFDGPNPLAIVPQRASTTTTPQALFLMNGEFAAKAAARVADHLLSDSAFKTDLDRVQHAYLRLLGREPTQEEAAIGLEYVRRGSWENYVQVLLCTNEFVYTD